jgi:hypothetical protein
MSLARRRHVADTLCAAGLALTALVAGAADAPAASLPPLEDFFEEPMATGSGG